MHNDQPSRNRSDDQKKDNQLNKYARFSSIAFQMFAIIGVGTFIGLKLDDYFNEGGKLYTIILSLVSVILAIVFVVRSIISSSED